MKRCTTLSRAPSELPHRRSGQRLSLPLCLAAIAVLGGGCLEDDTLSEDEPTGAAGSTAGRGPSSGGTGASAAGSAAMASAGRGGRGGSSAVGAGGSGGSNAISAGAAGASDDTPDDGAAEGETGIFVGMTAAHNAVRQALDEDLPDLTWSPQIAAFSQQWSDTLAASECGTIEHRDQREYGENIAMRGSSRLVEPFSPEEAVDGWAAEVACWDFGTIEGSESCDPVCAADLFSNGCGHYTQLVWRNTRQVGCGYSTCEDGGFTYEIWVCNYDPPGNFIGQAPY